MIIRYAIGQSYLGWVLVAATELGICRIDIDDDRECLRARLAASLPEAELLDNDSNFNETVSRLLSFLEKPGQHWDLPLDIQGTAFQRQVWMALRDVPSGTTVSYADIADRIGRPKAARAVAQACASNKLAVAIPCHRVVRSDGELGGYRWGIGKKRMILEREKEGVG